MSGSPSNVVRLYPRGRRLASTPATLGDDLQSLEKLSESLAVLKGTLLQAIANYSQACVACGEPDPQAQLSNLLTPVETLEAGMHRLAGAMAANRPR